MRCVDMSGIHASMQRVRAPLNAVKKRNAVVTRGLLFSFHE